MGCFLELLAEVGVLKYAGNLSQLPSSVGSHHGGTERRVPRQLGRWAFVAVPPSGPEITVFESLCLSQQNSMAREA